MKISQLKYFCAVSQYHSITQAAQKVNVTQPAISNAIRAASLKIAKFIQMSLKQCAIPLDRPIF